LALISLETDDSGDDNGDDDDGDDANNGIHIAMISGCFLSSVTG